MGPTASAAFDQLFASGRALDELDRLESVVAAAAAADRETVEGEAETLRVLIRERTAALDG